MAVDPKELQGVEGQPGTGEAGGVPASPAPEPAPVVGQPPVAPAVPPEPPTAPEVAPKVNLDELDEFRRWKSEADRRQFEMQQRAMAAEQRARDLEVQAQTAGMDDEEKWKYMSSHYQRQLGEVRQQLDGMQQLMQAQYQIAEWAGINPGVLNPMAGWEGMIQQAFKAVNAQKGQAPAPTMPRSMPTQPTPTQPTTPKAPSAPSSTAPTSDFQEWASGKTWQERKNKLPKGKAFEKWMEELGEE